MTPQVKLLNRVDRPRLALHSEQEARGWGIDESDVEGVLPKAPRAVRWCNCVWSTDEGGTVTVVLCFSLHVWGSLSWDVSALLSSRLYLMYA